MRSIIQKDRTHCFLCGMNANLEPLEEHHVFGAAYRDTSEEYGLKVYLHANKCHKFGAGSVHKNAKVNNEVKAIAQKIAMRKYGWNKDQFRDFFGKSYI